jgi:hypothetical protein
VNHPSLNATGPPTESRVTLGAVHLITAVNFENNCSALWTMARVLGEKLGRLDTIRVARVWIVLVGALNLVTLWTGPIVTHTTLPRRAQEPTTLGGRTRSYKLTLLVINSITMEPHHQTLLPPLHVLNIYHDIADHLAMILTHLVPKNKSVEFVH